MSLKEQLQQDLHAAMRAKDERRKSVLRMALTAIQLAEVEQGVISLDDEAVQVVLRQEVRRREDALEMVRQAGREDLVAEDALELDILKSYLPQLLSEEEIATAARAVIAEVGATSPAQMGKVMSVLMPRLQGKADGRQVNQIVRDLLSA